MFKIKVYGTVQPMELLFILLPCKLF